jgi:cytochrome c peroxidase
MKKQTLFLFVILLLVVLLPSFRFTSKHPMEVYRPYLLKEMEEVIKTLELISHSTHSRAKMQDYYHKARKHYKHIELFVEACSPIESKFSLNGPLVPKSDPEYGSKVFYPNGFQAIEEILFSDEEIDSTKLQSYLRDLTIEFDKLRIYYSTIQIEDEILLEMLQYELYRITSINLNGYDATITLTGLQETIWCLDGMEVLIKSFSYYNKSNKKVKELQLKILYQLNKGRYLLKKGEDYHSFNRLQFIRAFVNVINKSLVDHHNATGLPWTNYKKALNLNNAYLFGEESLNMGFFSIYYNTTPNQKEKQELGEKIFFDPILSNDNTISCATCHDPRLVFTDGFPKSIAHNRKDELTRNAPTLLNVAFQQSFFYDGRVYQLEQQVIDVIHNPTEVGGDLIKIAAKLQTNETYKLLFEKAFEGTTDAQITPYAVVVCLSEFERKLISLNSRFDRYLRGDETTMNSREINGYNLFAGKALCGSCHFFPLFNGTVPPIFKDTEFEVLGTPLAADNKTLDRDLGRYEVTKNQIHKFSFKTPTLRNIELTAPYMHNGAYTTLEQVIDFYHKGGGAGLGFNVPNQTLPFDSLLLTPTEKEDIILFLKTLTDTTSYGSF